MTRLENIVLQVTSKLQKASGFTMIELIMVVIILGVLAIYAAPAALNTGMFISRGFHDETLSLLRAAQKIAVVQQRTVCVQVNPTGVTLTMDAHAVATGVCNAAPSMPNRPRGGTGLSAVPASFKFNSLGGTDQTSAVTLSIANSTPITVEADTGFVHD